MSTIDDIIAWMNSPEGKTATAKQEAREARFPKVTVTVPEELVGLFAEEFKFLAAKGSPWVHDCGEGDSERGLIKRLILARECALRLTPEECRALYQEKARIAHLEALTDESRDRLYELNVITAEHPISMNIDIVMLIVDPRLDPCGYAVAPWLPGYIEESLERWRTEVAEPYKTPWVDAALSSGRFLWPRPFGCARGHLGRGSASPARQDGGGG